MKCKDCQHCKIHGKNVWCYHPNDDYIYEWFKTHKIKKSQGFLGYTYKGFPVKKSPAWCPFKAKQEGSQE